MVKVAFLVEGKVEKTLIDFLVKDGWFNQFNIEQVGPTIDVKGGGGLCPHNMLAFVEQARTYNPDKILILTDFECDLCVTKTKERLGDCDICVIVLARKAIEAWFLADDNVISQLTRGGIRHHEEPENTILMPYDTLKELALEYTDSGVGSKIMLCNKVLKRINFRIENAAAHPNCDSAQYFLDKLRLIGDTE